MATRDGEREPEIVPRSGTIEEMVSQGALAIRVQNDSMLSAAIARPRSLKDVVRRAIEELETDPEEAHAARYSLPFRDKRRDDDPDAITRIEGLSINAAMSLARNWGNCSVGANMLGQDVEGFDIEGYFIDLETNFRVSRPFRVSRTAKAKRGGVYQLDPQRLLMAIQAGASKGLRNAILAGLPPALKNRYERRAIEIAAGGDPDAKADDKMATKIIDRFKARYGIPVDKLEAYLGQQNDLDGPLKRGEWKGRHVADLVALGTSIRDGQVKAEDVFPAPAPATPGAEGSKLDTLAAALAKAENGTKGAATSTDPKAGAATGETQQMGLGD